MNKQEIRKTKEEKGITLMALIITIIVLLILAVVSIRAVTGDGIIAHARNARSEYGKAQTNEKTTLDSNLEKLDDATKVEGLTTQQAVAAGLKVGDYVEYPVQYSNVGTSVNISTGEQSYYPADSYVGWRVLSIEGEGENSYIRLVSAGVPLNYYHYTDSSTTVTNLTTGFFSTPINSILTQNNFYFCGFKDASGNAVTSIDGVKNLFTNKYTQMEGTTPKVQSITKADIDAVCGSKTTFGTLITDNDLLVISCELAEDNQYAMVGLASSCGNGFVWYVSDDGSMDSNLYSVLRYSSCSFSEI